MEIRWIMEIIEANFTIDDLPVGAEVFVWSKTDNYIQRYGKSPAFAIKSGETYFMPTPDSSLSIEIVNDIINKKTGKDCQKGDGC